MYQKHGASIYMIRIYLDRQKHWQIKAAELFAIGLKTHGITPEFGDSRVSGVHGTFTDSDELVVMWSANDRYLIEACRVAGIPYLIMEAGYWPDRLIDRQTVKWTSLGFNGLNGRAIFNTKDAPGDRFAESGHELGPWKHDGEGYLIIGQIHSDAAVAGFDINGWYEQAAAEIRSLSDDPIWFRTHPLGNGLGVGIDEYPGDLAQAIAEMRCVITYSSNVAVEAVLAGTPAISLDPGSMAYPVTAHAVQAALEPEMPDREQWVYNLAYSQWLDEEIASGLAWEHLENSYVYASESAARNRADRTR